MTKRTIIVMMAVVLCANVAAQADIFGTGSNQFNIDFVTISGATNPASGIPAGSGFTFMGVNESYRIGTYEITNDQWDRFQASLGVAVTGHEGQYPGGAYDNVANYTGINMPSNNTSWYEAAQFVNWLNTSAGHHAAYNFTGTQGTTDYTFDVWSSDDAAAGGTNLYRHKDAFYFLPAEDEWVKAAYWNGATLQEYSTPDDSMPIAGVHSRYSGTAAAGPWDVGSGIEELNGTFDMMGNIYEWTESSYLVSNYETDYARALRGGSIYAIDASIASSRRHADGPDDESWDLGFRVAANVPEPCSLALLSLGGLAMLRRKKQ